MAQSQFIKVGPNVNGFGRVVPPKDDILTVINSLECRQNAEPLPELDLSVETMANFSTVVKELEEHC